MLLRSGHKNAVQQLDKFGIVDKAIVSLGNDHPNKTIDILVKDQGKKFKNLSALATYIKNKEK
jgi:hypothetical protein